VNAVVAGVVDCDCDDDDRSSHESTNGKKRNDGWHKNCKGFEFVNDLESCWTRRYSRKVEEWSRMRKQRRCQGQEKEEAG
jgi:hypothetical protein